MPVLSAFLSARIPALPASMIVAYLAISCSAVNFFPEASSVGRLASEHAFSIAA